MISELEDAAFIVLTLEHSVVSCIIIVIQVPQTISGRHASCVMLI